MKPLLLTSQAFVWLVVLFGCLSCAPDLVYNEFRVLPSQGWTADTHCNFEVEMKDAPHWFDVVINIRHTGSYPYQDVWLIIDRTSPDGQMNSDTIMCPLADSSGRWLGIGSGLVYLVPVVTQPWKVETPGKYFFKIRHAMSDEFLHGVSAIGLLIKLQDGKE